MRLLIVTQIVDLNDPVLGFFHRWIEGIAAAYPGSTVVCLREGIHNLPPDVSVRSLGKNFTGRSTFTQRIRYAIRFCRIIWKLRDRYDAVFVHMNPEYVVLGGIFWRITAKRIVLWRNHRRGGFVVRLGSRLAHTVCYTSPESFVARYRHAVKMPIGIDTDFFVHESSTRVNGTLLMLGRLDSVKNVECFISALKLLNAGSVKVSADIYGDSSPGGESYGAAIRQTASSLIESGAVRMHPGISHSRTADVYAAHDIYVNLTPSGSFDKTIGEAAAAGCILVVANEALRGTLPDALIVNPVSPQSVADGIRQALDMNTREALLLRARLREYVERSHSLRELIRRITACVAI